RLRRHCVLVCISCMGPSPPLCGIARPARIPIIKAPGRSGRRRPATPPKAMKPQAGSREAHRASARSLDFLFAPRSIAVIGATDKEGSVGRSVLENLRSFAGGLYPINPNHESILGMQSFPAIDAAPGPVDLAVIATPAATVPGI